MRSYEPVKGYFPYPAVISVTICLFANNYAITSCFAYTGALVVHLGAAKTRDEAGYAAGLLASSFMIGRGMTALGWGLLADKYGRRPVLILCCLAMVVFQLLFGFATSFPMALAARFFLGAFNGLVGTSKTAVAELVPGDDVKLQSKAMGILGGAVSFGQLIGPSVGGWFADPVSQFPEQYKDNVLLKKFPFIIPNMVGAASALVATICVYFFLPETKSTRRIEEDLGTASLVERDANGEYHQSDDVVNDVAGNFIEMEMTDQTASSIDTTLRASHDAAGTDTQSSRRDTDADADADENESESESEGGEQSTIETFSSLSSSTSRSSVFAFCSDWRVLWPCLVYSFHSLNSMWLNEVFPLWCLGSKASGGLSLSLYEIGMLISISSTLLVLFQAIGFHRLVTCLSPTKVFIGGALSMIPFVFLMPLTAPLSVEMNYTFSNASSSQDVGNVTSLRSLTLQEQSQRAGMMVVVGFLFGMSSVCSVTTFATSFMLINNSCSNDERGAVNGLAMTIASITKAIGPVIGSSILAWSFTNGKKISWILGHPLNFWIVCSLWLVLGILAYQNLPQYHLDVHYESSGNEVDFTTLQEVNDGRKSNTIVNAKADDEEDVHYM